MNFRQMITAALVICAMSLAATDEVYGLKHGSTAGGGFVPGCTGSGSGRTFTHVCTRPANR